MTKKITVDIINPNNEMNLENKEISAETGIKYHEDIVTEGEEIILKEEKEIPLNLEISGNSEQKTYSGKNKYPLPDEQTINGIKVSHNKDGTFNLIGTATAETFIVISTTNILNDKKVYTISKNTTNVGMAGYEYNINTWLQTFVSIGKSEKSKTFTYNKNSNMTRNVLQINIANGTVLNETNIKIMLEENSNETEWEPYVGGIPAPNPDYPSEIKTVGSNVNIFDCSKGRHEGTYNGINIRYENGYLVLNGTSTNVVDIYLCYSGLNDELLNHLNNNYGKYTLSNNLGFENYIQTTSGYKNNVADITENDKAIRAFVRMPSQKTYSNEILKIKLVEGTEVGEYSKYGQGAVKVTKCNKNLFDIQRFNKNLSLLQKLNISSLVKLQNGFSFVSSGVDSYFTIPSSSSDLKLVSMKIEPLKTYCLSYISEVSGIGKYLFYMDKNYKIIKSNVYLSDKDISSFTTPENAEYVFIRFGVYNKSGTTVNVTNIQLEEGLATAYEEHKEQSYIIPTQQEMLEGDYFDWDNEEEVHNWNKLVLNGTEKWIKANNKETDTVFAIFVTNGVNDSEMSNSFLKAHLASSIAEKARVFNGSLYIEINTNRLSEDTVDGFKSWLKSKYDEGTPVIVYYKLSTPTRLPFTEEQKEIAKELSHATTYEGTTHIYSTDSISPVLKTTCGSEIVPLGNYIIQKPDNEEVKDKTTFTGYDYMSKFDVTYIDDGLYPIKLYDKLNNLCKQVGIKLGTKEIVNGDYEILGNPFTNNETCKTVLSNIAQLACGFAKIGRDNKLYIITLSNKENINEVLDANCYMDDFSKNDIWGEVNSLIIRLSQVEGENTVRQDEESIQKNSLTEITISDNYFLIDSEEREKVIQAIWENIKGLKYLPFSTTYYGFPYLDVGDMIKILDTKNNEYISYIFNHEFTYNGSFTGTIETKALTKTQTALKNTNNIKTKFRNVEYKVNKIDGQITTIIEQQTETENKITQAQQDIDGFTQKVATKDELTEKVNELKHTIEGITLQAKETGGGNIFFYAKEYWRGQTQDSEATLEEYTNTLIQQNNVSDEGYLINKGVSIQSQVVKNGQYVISFNYYKLKTDATGYVKINEVEYKLDGEINNWIEKIIPVEITSNNIKIEIGSDTVASYYISDLMVSMGVEKNIWTQNANETRTDTVEIGKGIQVNSSTKNTYTRIDADGNRTFNSSTNERVAEMTDKGVYTKQLEVKEQAKINVLLIQQIGSQVWLTGLGG